MKFNYLLNIGIGNKLKEIADEQRRKIINQTSAPLISIILPNYNSEVTIEATIESIEKQTYRNWELIIVDDGSTDNSLSVVKKTSKYLSKITIYSNSSNKGVAYSRNVGLYFANGEYITFHDADDISHPERLSFQISQLLKSQKKIVIFKYFRVDKELKPFIINGKKKWNRVSGMMFHKDLIVEIGYFKPTHISEDSEYHERILAVYGRRSRKIINKVLYFALFSPDSLLFSNADVEIKGNKINYKIKEKEAFVLEQFREEHEKIKDGSLSPYQDFEIDKTITSLYTE